MLDAGPRRRCGAASGAAVASPERGALLELERRHDAVAAHQQHVGGDEHTTATGSSRMWKLYIWPKFVTLKNAPTPTAFSAVLRLRGDPLRVEVLL